MVEERDNLVFSGIATAFRFGGIGGEKHWRVWHIQVKHFPLIIYLLRYSINFPILVKIPSVYFIYRTPSKFGITDNTSYYTEPFAFPLFTAAYEQ